MTGTNALFLGDIKRAFVFNFFLNQGHRPQKSKVLSLFASTCCATVVSCQGDFHSQKVLSFCVCYVQSVDSFSCGASKIETFCSCCLISFVYGEVPFVFLRLKVNSPSALSSFFFYQSVKA